VVPAVTVVDAEEVAPEEAVAGLDVDQGLVAHNQTGARVVRTRSAAATNGMAANTAGRAALSLCWGKG